MKSAARLILSRSKMEKARRLISPNETESAMLSSRNRSRICPICWTTLAAESTLRLVDQRIDQVVVDPLIALQKKAQQVEACQSRFDTKAPATGREPSRSARNPSDPEAERHVLDANFGGLLSSSTDLLLVADAELFRPAADAAACSRRLQSRQRAFADDIALELGLLQLCAKYGARGYTES